MGSSIARLSHAGAYTHAGPEIGVASTKAFTAQLAVLTMIALKIAHEKGSIDNKRYMHLLNELHEIPEKVPATLQGSEAIRKLAEKYKDAKDFLYLGRGYNFPVALEGALKLKEISYIHAEGYPAAEMKHGPIALIDKEMPVIVLAPQDSVYRKIMGSIEEVKSRDGIVFAIATEGDTEISQKADETFFIPPSDTMLNPLLSVVPLQLLAYSVAVLRGCDVDKPRNLAKSVTVE